jgi:hypothetical protein
MRPSLALPERTGLALALTGKTVELDMRLACSALQIFPEKTGPCPEGEKDDE